MAETGAFSKNSYRTRIVILSGVVLLISLLYYVTVPGHVYYHTLFRDLFFLPLILSAFWFGLEAAVVTAAVITIMYLPSLVSNWQGFSPLDFRRILEILLFNAVAAVLGYLSSREKAKEKALRESESLAAMGTALAAVAHELKNPLTAIGGFSRLLQKKLKDDAENRERLDVVIRETDRLEALVRDMLDFARPLELGLTRADLNQVVLNSLSIAENEARNNNVRVTTDLARDLPLVDFDPMRMEQVLINLVINGIQASLEGEAVLVRTHNDGHEACIEVVDHGPGIPLEHRKKIFTPFFTTKKGGTGLGLPIALKIIRAHAGKIEPVETVGRGTTFNITLPLPGRQRPEKS
jgi:two-component system, NtrC family, sensor histidine kinase HydH